MAMVQRWWWWWWVVWLVWVQGAGACPETCACKWKNGKQTVECQGGGFTSIPSGLDHGTQVLDLSINNLQVLYNERFKKLGLINLQKIFLSQCKITKIEDKAFKGLSNLVELDISQNMLLHVPSTIFSDIPSLMRLNMSENPIKTLKSNGFQHLPYLATLELSNCDIMSIEEEAFVGLNNLEWLKIDGNKLTTMRGSQILPESLHAVDLYNNKWQCDCNSQDLHSWLISFNIRHSIEPRCSSPPRLASRPIKSLTATDLACLPDVSPTTFYLEISEGRNISLLCQVSAIPEAKVSWSFQGQVLQNDSMVAPGIHLYYYIEEGTVEKRSELFIYNTNSEDNGTFSCVAENPAGKSQSNYTIRVIVKEEPIVIVVKFPFEYILMIAIGIGIISIMIFIILIVICVKCRRNKKRNKKKENSVEVALQHPTGAKRNGDSRVDSAPPKLNGSIMMTDQNHHVAIYSNDTRDFVMNNIENMVCLNASSLRNYQLEQNPDLINDTESIGNGKKNTNKSDCDSQHNLVDDEMEDDFDTNTVLSLSSAPPRQVKWQDQQNFANSVATLPRGARNDIYQHVADVHLNPGCYLDNDGYPIDFGLPKIQTIQQPMMVPENSNNFYRTLPHNRSKLKSAPNQVTRFSREAEYFVRSLQPPSYEHYSPADVRYTIEGYPYNLPRQQPVFGDQQVGLPEGTYIPSPPEGYKSGPLSPSVAPCCASPQPAPSGSWPTCDSANYLPQVCQPKSHAELVHSLPNGNYVSTRCVPTQTVEIDDNARFASNNKPFDTAKSRAVSKSSSTKNLENPSESPDEGYVGDGGDASEI